MIKFFRNIIFIFLRFFIGVDIIDCETNKKLGRAIIFYRRGKLEMWGLDEWVKVKFLPLEKLKYRRVQLGFYKHNDDELNG